MALKIWTFLLVMSLPAAEHGRGFGSLAAVLNGIDYRQIQQKLFYPSDTRKIPPATTAPWFDDDDSLHRVDKRAAPKITNKNPYVAAVAAASGAPSPDGRCMARVQSALGDMMSAAATTVTVSTGGDGNRRHTAHPSPGFMDLSGYALHQRLRTAPGAEMYVTGMRAKVMPPRDPGGGASDSSASGSDFGGGGDVRSWARVDGCQYDPLGNTLEARMRFGRTIMVSGSVRLLYGGGGNRGLAPAETGCDMTLRLRPRAGLGFTAAPLTMPEKSPPNRLTATPTMTIRTTATFIDPEPADDPAAAYVSVHSYNCVGGAAGFPGNREHPAASSSDRYEQIMSAEDGSDEQLAGGDGSDFDIDLDDGTMDFKKKFGDMRSSSRRPSPLAPSPASPSPPPSPPPPPTTADVTAAVTNLFVPAGFVAPSQASPEPRIRRIQYHNKPPQHPLMTVTGVTASHHQQTQDQLLMEMEDVFVRGVRSLLAKHMERTLQPVLKDSLMANMGYTVSYG